MKPSSIRIAFVALTLAAGCGAPGIRAADFPAPSAAPEPRPAVSRRPPIVIIPGAPGSELLDATTGQRVWPSARLMSKKDGNAVLALPLNDPERTTIVAGGVLREVHVSGLIFHIRAYDGLEKHLRELGYRPGDWKAPRGDAEYFYFPYDWRLSVEASGRRLARELTAFYRRCPTGTPPAVLLGHSLGGLLARYALMYGDAPLGADGPLPPVTWAGAATIGSVFLVATPNEGTFLALKRLERGIFYRAGHGAFSPETLFSYPSVFDMIPKRLAPLVDDTGKPLPFNLDDPDGWDRAGWSVLNPRSRSLTPYAARRQHLASELARHARLWEALDQLASTANPVRLYVVAGGSKDVQRSALVTGGRRGVTVHFDLPPVARSRFKPLLFEPGDTMVPVRSPLAESSTHDPASSLYFTRVLRSKRTHQALLSSPELLTALNDVVK